MDCEYSNPVTYTGDPPTSTLDQFQFSNSHCDFTNTTPVLASTSATLIDIASSSAVAKGIYDIFGFFFIFAFCVVLGVGWYFGTWVYKR